MKKIIFNLFIASLTLMFFQSCEEETTTYDVVGGDTVYFFSSNAINFPVSPDDSMLSVDVGVTTRSSIERAFEVTVNEVSTAAATAYNLDLSTLVIPANAFNASFSISADINQIPDEGVVTVVLDLTPTNGYAMPDKKQLTLSLFRSCPTSLGGQYSVTTDYGFHDFLPDFSSHTMNVTVFPSTVSNFYYVSDFSGGLYSVGPYCPAYNTCTAPQNRLDFEVNCGAIQWSGQTEPFGALDMLDGGVNTYDSSSGILTISWFCPAYGEFGTSVYTPL
jgi:hypothetical protein